MSGGRPLVRYLLLHAYGRGGTIRTVMNQATALTEAGWRVEIVSVLRRRDDVEFPLHPDVPVTALVDLREDTEPPKGPFAKLRAGRRARRLAEPPQEIPEGEFGFRHFSRYAEEEIIRFMAGLRDGILVTTRPGLNLLAARHATAGVVRVAQEHMNHGTYRPDVRRRVVAEYPAFDAVAVLTERDRAEYARLLPGTEVVRIPNAVHTLDQAPAEPGRSTIALAAGRLAPQKGFDLLIDAWAGLVAEHPDWQLRIYGSGEDRAELRERIEEHHLYNHVLLMGHTAELDKELAKAALYVLSSRFEGLPMVMIEAMSHGLPVVAFDCPTGPADVLTDGTNGLLVPPQDVEALSGALERVMDDPGLRSRFGETAALAATAYGPDQVHPHWARLFTRLHDRRHAAAKGQPV